MKYNTADHEDLDKAFQYLTDLAARDKVVEVKEIRPKRSLKQNSYLHLAIGLFGLETGYTMEEAKIIYKRHVNPGLYVYEKGGEKFLKSSTDLDTKEMTISIDAFREFAAEQGIHIPAPTDEKNLMSLSNRLEETNFYIRG